MASIQERLRRMREGEPPAQSQPTETRASQTEVDKTGLGSVYDRLARMRQDSEEISRQREAKEQQIQQARVDLLDQALERQRRQDLSSGTIRNPADFTGEKSAPRSGSFGGSGQGKRSDVGFTGERVSGQPDWGEIAKGVVLQGADQAATGITSTLSMLEGAVMKPMGALLGNDQLYESGIFHTINDRLQQAKEANEEHFTPEYKKAGRVGEVLGDFGPSVVAAVPQAVLAFMTAGTSAAAQGTTAGVQAAGQAAQGAGVARTFLNTLRNTAQNPQFLYSVLSTAGNEYEQAKAEGADDGRAYAYAALTGLLNSVVEASGGIDTLTPDNKRVLRQWVDTMLDEGREEVIQGAVSRLAQNAVYGRENPLFSLEDENAVVNPSTAAREFLGGAVVGGILGGGQLAVQQGLNAAANRQAARRAQEGAQAAQGDGGPVTQGTVQEAARGQESPENDKATARADSRAVVEKLRENIQRIGSMEPVSRLTGSEFQKSGGKLTDQVGAFFRRLGNRVTRRNFGDVILDERSIKNDIANGIGRAKAITFAAVPDVIANGQQIDYQENWKGRGKDSYIFAAPVVFGNQRGFVAAVVIQGDDNRFYLHEVIGPDGELIYIKKDAPETVKTGISARGGDTGGSEASSDITIPQESRGVNAPAAAMENEMAGAASDGRASSSGTVDTVATPAAPSVAQGGGAVNADLEERFRALLVAEGADSTQAAIGGQLLARAAAGEELNATQEALVSAMPGGGALLEAAERTARRNVGNIKSDLTSPERQMIVERTVQRNGRQEEISTAGDSVSDGGQGRLSGTGAGEQFGRLGAGAGATGRASQQFRTASSRQDRVNALRQERVSSRELGVPRGTTEKVIRTIPEESWDDELRSTADRVYRETGLPVTYVTGGLQVETQAGARLVRGVYTGERIIIQADNLRVTTDQIADHEIFHDKAAQTPGLVREIREQILEQYDAEAFGRIAETYARKLRGLVDIPESASMDEIDGAALEILEEIFADAYAGINAFSAHAEQYNAPVELALEERGIGRGEQYAAGTDQTTGPPAGDYSGGEPVQNDFYRYSVDEDGEGDLYRDEGMSDVVYNTLNKRWRAAQERRQQQTVRREDFDTVDEYTAAMEERSTQEKAERVKPTSREEFGGTEALKRLGVKISNSAGIYDSIQELMESDRAAKSVRRERRRAERRLDATAAERSFASGVATGIYSTEDIPASMDADKVMELADYYWAERAAASDMIRQRRTDINRRLSEQMEELFKDSDDFKPSRAIVLNHRTPERNMLRIFGDERGAAINKAIFDPVAENEAERIRFVNRMYDEVRTFQDSSGRQSELSKEERAVVQQVIEGRAVGETVASMEMSSAIQSAAENIRNGADPADAAVEFGLDREQRRLAEQYSRWLETQEILKSGQVDSVKVENAVKKYGELFDRFYAAINDFLVAHGYEPIGFIKGYAPHVQPESNQNLLNRSLQAMGINTDVTRLPASIAGLTANYRPNKRWNPYFLQRTSDITQYDIATAFESYVDYMSDVLYHTDDIMRVRQAASYFRRTYAPDEIRENLSWADELRYGSTDEKAAFLRDHDVISTTSSLTPEDVSQAMDDYVDQLYENITRTTKYSELVSYLDNYANILAGKQSMADRGWEYSSGRTVLNLGNKLVRAFGRAQVAGNLSSALNQTAQLPQIFAELGARDTAGAIADIWSGKLRRAGWAQESDFLTGKKGIDYLVTDPADMVVSALFKPAEFVDSFVSAVAVRGRYLREIRAGKSESEAMKAADAWGRSIMGSRAKGSRPLAFEAKNPVAQMVNVFQVEALNTWEHLFQDLPRDFREIEQSQGRRAAARALGGVIVKMLLSAFLLNRAAEETYGGTPAPFDLLGLSANFIASGEGLTTNDWLLTVVDNGWEQMTGERLFGTEPEALEGDFDWGAAAEDLAYNVSNDVPYLRNVTGLLGLGDETLPLPDLYGAGEGIVDAVANSGLFSPETLAAVGEAAAEVLPGGRQLSKTARGISTIARGGRYRGYGDQERLQYPVEGNLLSTPQALLFGDSALAETSRFYASGESGLSARQTQLYKELVEDGADSMEVYRGIQDYREVSGDETLPPLDRGKQERDVIRELDLTDEQKLALYHGLTGADSRAEKFQALMDAGMSWDEVMDAYDRYAELDADETLKATDKATELARWADGRYPEEQAEAVREQLSFYSMIPAQAERYTALTEAGLDADTAYDLTNTLAGLEPEDDMERVSKLQQYTAIADLPMAEADKESALALVMSDSAYEKYQGARSAGVSTEDYVWFLSATDGLEADKDENGKSISGSRKAKVLRVIDRMDLNRSQKDALFLAAGYSESTLGDAPWR